MRVSRHTYVMAAALLVPMLGVGCQLLAGIDARSLAADEPPAEGGAGADSSTLADGQAAGDADASLPQLDGGQVEGGFCATRDAATVAFCDDFDEPGRAAMSQRGWTVVGGFPEGAIDTSSFFSAPAAARFRFGSDAGPGRAASASSVVLAAPKTTIAISMKVRIHSGTAMGGLELGGPGCAITWRMATNGLASYCSSYVELGSPGGVATDTWVPVRMALEQRTGKIHLATSIGAGAQALPYEVDIPTTAKIGLLPFVIGDSTSQNGIGTIDYDDVLVETY